MSTPSVAPWKASKRAVPESNTHWWHGAVSNRERTVAGVYATNEAECLANARLIAAAPRMLALIRTLLLTGDDLSAVELCRLEARAILRDVEGA